MDPPFEGETTGRRRGFFNSEARGLGEGERRSSTLVPEAVWRRSA